MEQEHMPDSVVAPAAVDEEFSALLDRARSGDADAATGFVRRYEPELRRYVRVRLTDSRLRRLVDSVDVCQSILGRFFAGFFADKHKLRSPEQLIALLLQMAKNEVCDQVRKQRAVRRGGRVAQASTLASAEVVADSKSNPSEQASNRELVEKVLRELPSHERLLAERRMAGFGWVELAAELQTDAEVLRKRFTRALRRLRLQDFPA
jgi:RNA polymerase sigma-70 factor (ECF subfamily)